MIKRKVCGGHILRIAIGITMLFLMQVGGASAVNYISGCPGDTNPIISPGEYVLSQNLAGVGNTWMCIVIASDNVILDGAGHWIIGNRHNSASHWSGIYVAGQNNVTVKNVNVRDWHYGIEYLAVQNGTILNSTAWTNEEGGFAVLSLTDRKSTNNTLINNSAYRMWGSLIYGTGFLLGGNDTVDTTNKVNGRPVYYFYEKNDLILDGIEAGFLRLQNSSNITVKDSIIRHGDGIELAKSNGNRIYHNNIIDNFRYINDGTNITWLPQAADYSTGNSWDNGYPSGGNYWNDYKGTDNFSGPNQDQPGSDGIGDIPYYIDGDAGAKDRYPFMKENGWVSPTDILSYYRSLGSNPNIVETTDLLKAADDWSNNIVPPGFTSPITTQQLLVLADEWSRS
jgi:hypothetical protein